MMKHLQKYLLIVISVLLLSLSIGRKLWMERHCLPKPVGHPRLALSAHEYVALPHEYPYLFEYSKHVKIQKKDKHNINLYYPAFDATIHVGYMPVKNNPRLLREYAEAAYKLSSKHQVKADSIEEKVVKTQYGLEVVLVDISGQVPSQFQFYTSDGKKHFIRAALYFNTAMHNDYLAPIIQYIREDMLHMVRTLKWRS